MSEFSIGQFKSRIRILILLFLLAIAGLLAWHINSERNAILTAAELQAQGYARALSEHAGSAFAEADRALRDLVLEIGDRGGIDHIDKRTLFHILRQQGGDTPQIGAMFLADRTGTMIVNSVEFPSAPIKIGDREYFQYDLNSPDAGLFISRPLISRLSNRWRFTMTRPLTGPEGNFQGLAAVAFEIDYFDRFFNSLNLGPGSRIQLIRSDGAPLVSKPATTNMYDADYRQSPLFRTYLTMSQSGTFRDHLDPGDSAPLIVSFNRLSRFPVVAVVSLHEDDILALWKRKIIFEVATTLGFCFVVIMLMKLLYRHLTMLEATQNSLREQQELVRIKAAQIDVATDAILVINTDGRLEHFNNALCIMTGYDEEEIRGVRLHDLEPPEYAARILRNIKMLQEQGEAIFESAYLTKAGSVLPIEVHARVMETDGIKRVLSIVRDISERKRVEQREHTRLRLLEDMATGVSLQELLVSIVRFVEQELKGALCSILLVDESGTHLRLGAAPSFPDFYNKAVDGIRIGEGKGSCGTAAFRRRRVIVEEINGHPYWKGFKPAFDAGLRTCWSEPVISSRGKLLGTLAVYHCEPRSPDEADLRLIESAAHLAGIAMERADSEEQKNLLEEQLHHVQKIEAIGHLAGGVAHDFNNLLTPIIGYAHMIQMKLPEQDPLCVKVKGIMSAAFKARDLTQQLLSFGRKQRLEMKSVDLCEIIRNFLHIMQRATREDISFDLHLPQGEIAIMADSGQIEQILLNLAVNARDAITAKGRIVIEVGHVVLDDEYARLHSGVRPGNYALLEFRDNGCGMSEENLRHIFEPFFTTKKVSHGTGLGLATVYGIIKQHEGYVTVRSRVSEGTIFSIYLPVSAEPATALAGVPTVPEGSETAGTCEGIVLVVEDNEMVRSMTVEMLESAGYMVSAVDGPSAALELARQQGDRISLLVSDVVMPGMNGMELYESLLHMLPGLRVLYISGYTNDQYVHNGTLEEGINFLQKPFTTEKLVKEVRRLLR